MNRKITEDMAVLGKGKLKTFSIQDSTHNFANLAIREMLH